MKHFVVILALLSVLALSASAESISAEIASGSAVARARATFRDVHERFAGLAVNESGFGNVSDQDGILRSILWAGGGRSASRPTVGGIDYDKFMEAMARHSPRIFPPGSRWLAALSPRRFARAERLRTAQNGWASTLTLDCSRPSGWPESRSMPWIAYEGRCKALVESAEAMLRGMVPSRCTGEPTTWGSHDDVFRAGGAMENGWREIYCDHADAVDCVTLREEAAPCMSKVAKGECDGPAKLARRQLATGSVGCASNRFFDWR